MQLLNAIVVVGTSIHFSGHFCLPPRPTYRRVETSQILGDRYDFARHIRQGEVYETKNCFWDIRAVDYVSPAGVGAVFATGIWAVSGSRVWAMARAAFG